MTAQRKPNTSSFPLENHSLMYDMSLEQAVLGAILIDKEAIYQLDSLGEDDFEHDHHKQIFSAAAKLYADCQPIDLISIAVYLRSQKSSVPPHYLAELSNRVASTANLEYHARILKQYGIRRKLQRLAFDLQKQLNDEGSDVFDIAAQAERTLGELAGPVTNTTEIATASMDALKRIESAKNNGGIIGIHTGFSSFDAITGGLQPDDMIIIGGRPGMGKSAFVQDVALNVAAEGYSVAIFSLEMSTEQITDRFISKSVEIPVIRMRSGNINDAELLRISDRVNDLTEAPIWIDDTAGITLRDLGYRIRRFVKKYNVKLVIIDYLQLINNDKKGGTRENEVSEISRRLKTLAKESKIPIIALSQLSRAVESRGGSKRPQLSDLRESGSLEQDSDLVAFLHRPEYYGQEEDEMGNSTQGICEVIVAKNRRGACDTIRLKFVLHCARFENLNSYSGPDFNAYAPADTPPW